MHGAERIGHTPVCDPDRVFAADGRSCSEADRMELALRFSEIIARLEPAPGSTTWVQVLRDAEAVEYSRRGGSSIAFRKK